MDQIGDFLVNWFTRFFDLVGSGIGNTIALFETPAQEIGLPAEIFAAILLCLVLVGLWRAMAKRIL